MLRRRSFLVGCGGALASPALASLGRPFATDASPPWRLAAPSLASAATPQNLVLRIDGWDLPGASDTAASGEAWIHISSSWKATWR
jgi:hypothetical protein